MNEMLKWYSLVDINKMRQRFMFSDLNYRIQTKYIVITSIEKYREKNPEWKYIF